MHKGERMELKMRPKRSLASELVDHLRGQIESGALAPGDRIPTERELVEGSGVSRTVVREAIARLTAEGLLEPRQGSGVFVTEPRTTAFHVSQGEFDDLVEVSRLLELHLAVEIEMAGLAARRRSEADIAEMRVLIQRIALDSAATGDGSAADEALHGLIAQASDNRYFGRFLEFLEMGLVPRRGLLRQSAEDDGAYLAKVHDEHVELVEAIARRDVDGAREAVRRHLEHVRARLEDFLAHRDAPADQA